MEERPHWNRKIQVYKLKSAKIVFILNTEQTISKKKFRIKNLKMKYKVLKFGITKYKAKKPNSKKFELKSLLELSEREWV